MSRPLNMPDRARLQRIINEEAERLGVSAFAVATSSRAPGATEARHAAILRALKETGCSEAGLAKAWGLSTETVRYAKVNAKRRSPQPTPYDDNTMRRLISFHGPERAQAIIRGLDPETSADIARWAALGERSAA